jgi:hypothetical protein
MTMASTFPSKGVGYPAARLAVRRLGTRRVGGLGPGGEVGGGVAVPVCDQAAGVAAKDALGQSQVLVDPPAPRAGLGGCKPSVRHHQLGAEPCRLVAELAGELSPSGVSDGAGQVAVGQQIGHGEVFQAQPIVGLDELAGNLMEECLPHIDDADMLPR